MGIFSFIFGGLKLGLFWVALRRRRGPVCGPFWGLFFYQNGVPKAIGKRTPNGNPVGRRLGSILDRKMAADGLKIVKNPLGFLGSLEERCFETTIASGGGRGPKMEPKWDHFWGVPKSTISGPGTGSEIGSRFGTVSGRRRGRFGARLGAQIGPKSGQKRDRKTTNFRSSFGDGLGTDSGRQKSRPKEFAEGVGGVGGGLLKVFRTST